MHHLSRADSTGFLASRNRPAEAAHQSRPLRTVPIERVRAVLLLLDLIGCVCLSTIVFALYGEALDYPRAQLWSGVGLFSITWLLASQSQQLYARQHMLDGRQQAMRAIRTCMVSFGLVLLLAFGVNVIGSFSRIWLTAWAGLSLAWVVLILPGLAGPVAAIAGAGGPACSVRSYWQGRTRKQSRSPGRSRRKATARSASCPARRCRAFRGR